MKLSWKLLEPHACIRRDRGRIMFLAPGVVLQPLSAGKLVDMNVVKNAGGRAAP